MHHGINNLFVGEMNADSPDWNECRSGENDCGDNSEKEKER